MHFDAVKHKNTLINLLKDIYTDPSLGPLLGFKGGTAAFFFYGLNRFSVDLDFDLLKEEQDDFVFEKMTQKLESYGKIKEARKKRYTLFFLLSYEDGTIWKKNIKVEINKRLFGSQYAVKSYLGVSMQVMVKADMFANKLVALYERDGKTNRDIYDAFFFFKNDWPINQMLIEQRTGLSFQNFLKKSLDILEKTSERHILSGIGELLDQKQKSWVKKNLKKETVFFLKLALENVSF